MNLTGDSGTASGLIQHDRAVIAALSTSDKIGLAAAVIAALGVLIAAGSLFIGVINERRRTQPIVMANDAHPRTFAPSSSQAVWVVDAYLTSEGGGPAFNVRFGVEFGGVRFPYRFEVDDPDSGNVQRVLKSSERRPEAGSWPILIDSLSMVGSAAEAEGDVDAKRIYWARYENAQKHTWETRNPADRSAKLDIRRIRWGTLWFREWRERRARTTAGRHDTEWVRKALDELRAGRNESGQEAETPQPDATAGDSSPDRASQDPEA